MATAATFPRMEVPNPDEPRAPVLSERAASALLQLSPEEKAADQAQESLLRDSNLAQLDAVLSKTTSPEVRAILETERASILGGQQGAPTAPGGMLRVGAPGQVAQAPRMPAMQPLNFRTTTPQIQALERQQQEFQNRSNARLDTLSTNRDEVAQTVQDSFGQPMPKRPTLGGLPQYEAKPYSQEDALAFGAIATAFVAIASLRASQPLTAALSAAGNAMQGYTNGRFAQVKQDLEVYKTQFNAALTANKQMLDEYQSIITDRNTSRAEKMAMWQVASARWNDEATKALLRNGQYDRAIHALYQRLDAGNRLEEKGREFGQNLQRQYDQMENQQAIARLRGQSAGGPEEEIDPQMKRLLAERWLAGDTTALTGFGYGKAAVVMRKQILEEAARLAAKRGLSGGDISAASAERSSLRSNLTQFGNYVNRLDNLAGKIDRDINTLFTVAEKGVGPTGIPVIEKWVQAGRRATGDSDVTAFDVAIQTLKNEYGRSMSGPASNAQLHVSAMEHADQLINSAMTLPQLKAAVGLMRQDMQNGHDQARVQLQQMRQQLGNLGQQPVSAGTPLTGGGGKAGGGMPSPQSQAEYDALPPGTRYRGSDGKTRIKGAQ